MYKDPEQSIPERFEGALGRKYSILQAMRLDLAEGFVPDKTLPTLSFILA